MGGFTLIYSFSSASQLKKPSYATWISMFDGQPPETPELLMLPQDQTPIIEKNGGGSEGNKNPALSSMRFRLLVIFKRRRQLTMGGPLIGDGSKPRGVRWLWGNPWYPWYILVL
jgi:hypothetical protein